MVFAAMLFFLLGYAALRLCLPDLGLILGHSRLCQCHIDTKRSKHKEKNGCVADAFHAMFNYSGEVFFGVAVAFGL